MRTNVEKCGTYGGLNMAEIDALSKMIGRIETTLEYQNKEISKVTDGIAIIKNTTEKLTTDSVTHGTMMKAMHERQDDMEPRLNWVEMIVKRALWIGGGAIAFISFLVNLIFPYFAKLFP